MENLDNFLLTSSSNCYHAIVVIISCYYSHHCASWLPSPDLFLHVWGTWSRMGRWPQVPESTKHLIRRLFSSGIITAPPFTLRGVPVPAINDIDMMNERHVKSPTAVQIVMYRYLSLKHRRVAHEASLKSVCHHWAALLSHSRLRPQRWCDRPVAKQRKTQHRAQGTALCTCTIVSIIERSPRMQVNRKIFLLGVPPFRHFITTRLRSTLLLHVYTARYQGR